MYLLSKAHGTVLTAAAFESRIAHQPSDELKNVAKGVANVIHSIAEPKLQSIVTATANPTYYILG